MLNIPIDGVTFENLTERVRSILLAKDAIPLTHTVTLIMNDKNPTDTDALKYLGKTEGLQVLVRPPKAPEATPKEKWEAAKAELEAEQKRCADRLAILEDKFTEATFALPMSAGGSKRTPKRRTGRSGRSRTPARARGKKTPSRRR